MSFNQDKAKRTRPHFQFHVWAIVAQADVDKGRSRVEGPYRPTVMPRQAAKTYTFDGNPAGFAYALKTSFGRRTTLPAGLTTDGTWRRQNTRLKPRLTVATHARLLSMLHELGLEGRLFLRGIQVVANKAGKPVIRPTRKTSG